MPDESLVPEIVEGSELDEIRRRPASRQRRVLSSPDIPHVNAEAVQRIAQMAESYGRGSKGKRDKLLILTLFDGCLRVSEALRLRPVDLQSTGQGFRVHVYGKGGKGGEAALSADTAAKLYAYINDHGLDGHDHIFQINRKRAHQIVQRAFHRASVPKPEGTGYCHVLRHSGAIARLRSSQNPKSIQDQLRHASPEMTMRYWKTLQREESLQIQERVNPWR